MSPRKKTSPYAETGALLEGWRSEKFRSALAMFKAGKFSFSYSAYADFERGVALPVVDILLELAKFHGKDEIDAVLAWAAAQMPTEKLKTVFRSRSQKRGAAAVETLDTSTKPPSLDNTWVFTLKDRALFDHSPWLADLCLQLVSAHPAAVSLRELGFKSKAGFKKFKRAYLSDWIAQGHILETADGLKIAKPHYHFPKSAEWHDLRRKMFLRMSEVVTSTISADQLEAGAAQQLLLTRSFSSGQVARWATRIKDLEKTFLGDPYEEATSTPDDLFSLILVFGHRDLRIPKQVVVECEA